jgi:hypothetical protein
MCVCVCVAYRFGFIFPFNVSKQSRMIDRGIALLSVVRAYVNGLFTIDKLA